MAQQTPSSVQLDALASFARANGRRWKAALQTAWENGSYRRFPGADDVASLQQVRNQFGPSWLQRFALRAEGR